MSLILTYDGELYKEPDNSYGEKTKIVKVIPKYDYKNFSHKNVTYRDKDENRFEIGDIVKLDTGEKLIFICEAKRFAHLCSMDSIDEFKGTIRFPLDRLEKNEGSLSEYFTTKLIYNIKEAFENDKHIAKEIKAKVKTLVM
jgi:uncharacterized protein YqfB (UPF0267 family)